ncbi:heparinase II/III domain-containing protein [Spirochaeta isovalerica]|uniref:Heparinase II/III-like C-terminal domain-containing protein n=1 Tax=Spirochaeta isovalerica TaxID=150 RepID=A0A841R9I9_9SPIO|nr:heparinase II/III family protein [Spirochaeta isovalerica]MBB6479887.1 hypothetical protein [Spirochaeta isovalerica]
MKYSDIEKLKVLVNSQDRLGNFVLRAREEVDDFFHNFDDSPDRTSRWAHHYFCEEEGARLLFDPKTPHRHECSVCGKVYENHELFDGCWLTMYRNLAVVNAWKSALIFKLTGEERFLANLVKFASYYSENYLNFILHNKEGLEFDNLEDAAWGVSRIMPQSLNEAIFIIRLVNAFQLVKEDLPDGFIDRMERDFFSQAFIMLKPQVHQIHNIPTWLNSAIGVMGLFLGNREMIDYAFNGPNNQIRQLTEGVTDDYFWYEGSIHYNFFLLEGVANLLLFCELYGYDFPLGKETVEKMLDAAYIYAFDNHLLPNPNDGWPDINLKTYSYVYAIGTKIFGEDSRIGHLMASIVNKVGDRGSLPLSKPYYFENDISLEELLFVPELRYKMTTPVISGSVNFKSSYCGLIKSYGSNVFIKYGHNGPSHAHPDKMNIEVLLKGEMLSRDLSNSGYGNPLCNEWHKMSPSHNTVVVNGESHKGFKGGECLIEEELHMKVRSTGVYEDVNFERDIQLNDSGFKDRFAVEAANSSIFDYFFHIEGELLEEPLLEKGDIIFDENGYQHIRDIKKVSESARDQLRLKWKIGSISVDCLVNTEQTEIFLAKSPDNSASGYRNTLILRKRGNEASFEVNWIVIK